MPLVRVCVSTHVSVRHTRQAGTAQEREQKVYPGEVYKKGWELGIKIKGQFNIYCLRKVFGKDLEKGNRAGYNSGLTLV